MGIIKVRAHREAPLLEELSSGDRIQFCYGVMRPHGKREMCGRLIS